jgi:hypothetical protein
MGTSESALSQDVVFDILSSSRRRYVLYRLREAEGPVELTKLAEQVAAWENNTDPDQITEQERKRVYVSLYQTHIPRLDEVGLVVYDKDSGQIELAADAEQIDDYLSSGDERIRWEWAYLGLAAASGVFLAVTAFGPLSGVPDPVATGLVVTGFVVLAVTHAAVRLTRDNFVPPELRERQ